MSTTLFGLSGNLSGKSSDPLYLGHDFDGSHAPIVEIAVAVCFFVLFFFLLFYSFTFLLFTIYFFFFFFLNLFLTFFFVAR